ncbi:GntR family transcriptional regulator [Palleronia caenipelagi]|uniref:GntR family transcriptional regulator n=1 Tax=Palleronia caenipelagi TaxID=2489174 RepID=A0A547PL16_9RHOB|nr:GntR family transcriptional regulator [Palleronia caenipelagi]
MLENVTPVQKDKLHDQVYDRLCTLLREGQFTPGEPVRVARVAEAFAVSAMPVREALMRLVAIGVLANVSGRSVGVPTLTLEELNDLRNVRLEVECLAVRWAVANRDDAFLKDLSDLLARLEETEQSGDIPSFIKTNYEFHFRLYRQSGSPVLMGLIDTLWLRVSPHLYQLEREDQFRVSNVLHREIVRAIRSGDAEAAVAALAQDLKEAYEVLLRSLAASQKTG